MREVFMLRGARWSIVLIGLLGLCAGVLGGETSDGVGKLVAALLGDTPMVEDLEELTDVIGGRPTGSAANERAVEWALGRFREAGVPVQVEPFEMPARWLERSASASVEGEGIAFSPKVAAMPFSTATPDKGMRARLVDIGFGAVEDFARVGATCKDAMLLVETRVLEDIPGLFQEYIDAAAIEERAFAAGARGVVYMGSRTRGVLYRHNASLGEANEHPLLVMEREGAQRALRLLRAGHELSLHFTIDIDRGDEYRSRNVIAEIRGAESPEEIVVIGAHLDSWDLGTGALDNACNVALVIDIARQIKALGLTPRRTIRFALYNGEEQGLYGSWAYTTAHSAELDRHVMASSYDIGSGRITGFLTGGRPEILAAVESALVPVAGLGPFTNLDVPTAGTDHFDFMLQGIASLVADQESANYGPNYHARTDTFDKVNRNQIRLNAAIAAAVTYGFAEMEVTWGRQSREEISQLIASTDLDSQMRAFHIMEDWESGRRGRSR
jgi:carboxypeptidase Q